MLETLCLRTTGRDPAGPPRERGRGGDGAPQDQCSRKADSDSDRDSERPLPIPVGSPCRGRAERGRRGMGKATTECEREAGTTDQSAIKIRQSKITGSGGGRDSGQREA